MSIQKKYSAKKGVCVATFKLEPLTANAPGKVNLAGSFNNWNNESIPMKKRKDGSYSASVELPFNTAHQFRYLVDGIHWENDDAADNYEKSPFGSDNSVIIIESNQPEK